MNAAPQQNPTPEQRPEQPQCAEGASALGHGEDDFALAAAEPGRKPALPAWLEAEAPKGAAASEHGGTMPAGKEFQFSLTELLGLSVAAALLWSVVVSVSGPSASLCAGLLGLVVLAGLIVLEVWRITRPILRIAWWVALAFYLMACVAAIVRG